MQVETSLLANDPSCTLSSGSWSAEATEEDDDDESGETVISLESGSLPVLQVPKYNYLASSPDSLVDSHRAAMRLSTSSPSSFRVNNEAGQLKAWRLLDEDDSISLLSQPSSSNKIPSPERAPLLRDRLRPCLAKVARAESESLLPERMARVLSATNNNTATSSSSSITYNLNRRSFRYGSPSGSSAETLTRRHSGVGTRPSGPSQAALTVPEQRRGGPQKASTCSLMMVSPTSVTRSPSQQWLRGGAGLVMPTSTSPSANPPQLLPTQNDPNSLAVVDHRNAYTPIPGTVNAAGGVHNPLYNVSNEFMRVAGYSQQFKHLLSKREDSVKKSSLDLPGVTFANDGAKEKDPEKGALVSPITGHDHEHAALAAAAVGLGGAAGTGLQGDPAGPDLKALDPNRSGRKSAYGRRLWKEQPNTKQRLKLRKTLYSHRTKVSDFALLFAITGMVLTILEAELTASGVVAKSEYASLLLRSLIVATTVVLLGLVIGYHAIETKIAVIDSGAEDWRVAITYDRLWQCALEVAVCSVCPFPANVNVTWDRLKPDHRTPYSVSVPLDAVLSVPMFLRTYLFGRFMALHSRQFQDAATRSIAALNHIAVNFTFVLKTLMHEHPLRVLILFTVAFWITMSWILTQCERYVSAKLDPDDGENNHYLNSIWFIIITFMSIGYGDIVPNTYCGRALAITTGIVGAGVSSALIAVISRKLELSRAEKHVNQFMTDSKLTRQRKEAAAAVLQHTWFIHKYKNIPKAKDDMKLRMHQRRFLAAINEFRRVKWDQRKLAEQGNALVDVAKLQSDMHETLWDMQQNQDHLVTQMGALMQKMQELQDIILAQNQTSQPQRTMSARRSAGSMTRQFSMHPGSPPENNLTTPIVIAQHVETVSTGTDTGNFDEVNGSRTVML